MKYHIHFSFLLDMTEIDSDEEHYNPNRAIDVSDSEDRWVMLSTYSYLNLAHSCWQIYATNVWIKHIFENNFEIDLKFTKYLNGSCEMGTKVCILFKYFLKISNIAKISS